jgi:predicted acylesterase/phospholipase RssA
MSSHESEQPRPIQLAIQGGGAKICALIAAMEVVEQLEKDEKIKITRIAGTSAGAIVGCLFAAGVPMAVVRERLRNIPTKELGRMFPGPGLNVLTLFSRGIPLWKTDFLEKELDRLLGKERDVYDFEQLANKKNIQVLVVAANLSESGKVVYGQVKSKKVIPAVLDSCGLPFCFRTWRQGGSQIVVDGGICENLPSDELEPFVATDGEIIGISFAPSKVTPPHSWKSFSMALLETAMNNSMNRARFRLGTERVFPIKTDIGTFDFAKALREGLDDKYEGVRLTAEKFFSEFLKKNPQEKTNADGKDHPPSVVAFPEDWEEQNSLMMSTLGEVYKKQHEPNKLQYLHCSVVIKANSLRDVTVADEVTYSMTFKTLTEAIYCHAVSLTETGNQARFDRSELSVTDQTGNPIEIRRVPIRDDEATIGTRLLLFLFPPLKPNTGTYTLEVKDLAHDVLKPLREKREDELIFLPLRATNLVDRIDLVVQWPKVAGELRMVPKHKQFPGELMDNQELKKYPRDYGFDSKGWTGLNVPSDKEFGVDLVFTKKG